MSGIPQKKKLLIVESSTSSSDSTKSSIEPEKISSSKDITPV